MATQYDGRNNVTDYAYDEYNRLVSVTNAKDETTDYDYDLNGNLLTQTDGNGYTKTFEYNVMNVMTRSIDHGGRTGTPGNYVYEPAKTESFIYNKNGTLLSSTDRKGVTTTYTYDVHGRMLSKSASSSTISFTYDGNGNQLTVTDATGTMTRTYDELNRVLTKAVPVIGTSAYGYDITLYQPSGYVAEDTTDPENNTVRKVYDKAGRLHSVIDGLETTLYTYYDNGARESVTYDNGAREEYTYSEGTLLTGLVNRRPDNSVMDTYSYAYGAAHNQTSKTEVVNNVTLGTTSYTYDALNRLLTVTEPGGRGTAYAYDDAGNRYTETVTEGSDTRLTTYGYNEQNRLTGLEVELNSDTRQTVAYGYDNNGNLLTETRTPYIDGAPQTPVVDVTNNYDVWNQLTQTVTEDNTVANTYNGEGLRTAKTVDGTTTRYLYNFDKVVLETDANGDEAARNVYGLNLLKREIGNDSYYYFYNGHADVTALVNTSTDAIAATYYYDAFGNIVDSTGSVSNNIRYAGYQYDDETGYYYLNARMYDPWIGRFLQEDTVTGEKNDPLSLNLYTYVKNNPLIYTDPTGHRFMIEADTPEEETKVVKEYYEEKKREKAKKNGGEADSSQYGRDAFDIMISENDILIDGISLSAMADLYGAGFVGFFKGQWSELEEAYRMYQADFNEDPAWHILRNLIPGYGLYECEQAVEGAVNSAVGFYSGVVDLFTTKDPYELAYKLGNFYGYATETAALTAATAGIGKLASGLKGSLKGSLASGVDDVALNTGKSLGKLTGSLDDIGISERRAAADLLERGKNVEIVPRSRLCLHEIYDIIEKTRRSFLYGKSNLPSARYIR